MQLFRIKALPILLVVILIFLQYRLWFDKGGILNLMRLKKEVVQQSRENDKLKKRNEKLLAQVKNIQQNKESIEARARHELGMVKQGEVFYQVFDKGN